MVSPIQTVRYVLAQHRERPDAEQPYLEFRYISRQDRLRIEAAFKAADAFDDERYFDSIAQGVRIALAGWSGYPVAYDPAKLDEVLSDQDYAELKTELVIYLGLSESIKKNSRRLRLSPLERSASEKAETASSAPPPSDLSPSTSSA